MNTFEEKWRIVQFISFWNILLMMEKHISNIFKVVDEKSNVQKMHIIDFI